MPQVCHIAGKPFLKCDGIHVQRKIDDKFLLVRNNGNYVFNLLKGSV